MKRILFVLVVCILFITSCGEKKIPVPDDRYPMEMTPQEFFDYKIRKSEIVDSVGHMYYLYESGTRGSRTYVFDLEHRMDCKACLDIFD